MSKQTEAKPQRAKLEYVAVKLNLSDSQLKKFYKGIKNDTTVTIEVNKNMINENGVEFKLTKTQYKKLNNSDSPFRITFSRTQLKKQGQGIWDAIMRFGRFIIPKVTNAAKTVGRIASKIGNTAAGSVIKSVAKAAAPGVISGAASAVVENAVAKKLNEQADNSLNNVVEATTPEAAVDKPVEESVEGKGLFRAGQSKGTINTGNGLFRAGQFKVNPIGGSCRKLQEQSSITLNLTKKEYDELINVFKILEKDNKLPNGTCEYIKTEIKQQNGGFLASLIASFLPSLLSGLFGGQKGSGIKEL